MGHPCCGEAIVTPRRFLLSSKFVQWQWMETQNARRRVNSEACQVSLSSVLQRLLGSRCGGAVIVRCQHAGESSKKLSSCCFSTLKGYQIEEYLEGGLPVRWVVVARSNRRYIWLVEAAALTGRGRLTDISCTKVVVPCRREHKCFSLSSVKKSNIGSNR